MAGALEHARAVGLGSKWAGAQSRHFEIDGLTRHMDVLISPSVVLQFAPTIVYAMSARRAHKCCLYPRGPCGCGCAFALHWMCRIHVTTRWLDFLPRLRFNARATYRGHFWYGLMICRARLWRARHAYFWRARQACFWRARRAALVSRRGPFYGRSYSRRARHLHFWRVKQA